MEEKMTRRETKAKILEVAAALVHLKGFNHTGIQEILLAAGVPKGSFYFYFKNKEEFGLDLVDHYMQFFMLMARTHLEASQFPPLERLKRFFDAFRVISEEKECKTGCPIGNIAQEMSGQNEAFRAKLDQAFEKMSDGICRCLEEAQRRGEVDRKLDPQKTADFILNSWEGALVRMKAEKSAEPLKLFSRFVFDRVLPG